MPADQLNPRSRSFESSMSTPRVMDQILVPRLAVTSTPKDLPGMFPNRLASPPLGPTTVPEDPCGLPSTRPDWICWPGVAILRLRAFVLNTVSLTLYSDRPSGLTGCASDP